MQPNNEKAEEVKEFVPTKEVDLFETLLKKTLININKLSSMMEDPERGWLNKKTYIAEVRELYNLLSNSLDQETKEELIHLNKKGLRGLAYWMEVRAILQRFLARKNLWAKYNQIEVIVGNICKEINLEGDFKLRRFKEVFVSESVKQKAMLSLRIQPAMRMRSDFKSLDNEFQGIINTILENHVVGERLISAMRKIISCYFIDDIQIEVWTTILKKVEEKKVHEEKRKVKIDRGVKIVVTKKAKEKNQ